MGANCCQQTKPGKQTNKEAVGVYNLNVVICGALQVGKTTLTECLVTKQNQQDKTYEPTKIADNNQLDEPVECDGDKCFVTFTDMAGNYNAKQLAKLFTKDADCILACYSLTSEMSFDELDEWLEEIAQAGGNQIPVVLVATKEDLAANERAVSKNRGMMKKRELQERCVHFCEVTTWTSDMNQITELLEHIIVPNAKKYVKANRTD